jgi:hypothetical protein
MKLFKCAHCGQLLYFENTVCEKCKYLLGFDSDALQLFPLTAESDGSYSIFGQAGGPTWKYCSNYTHGVCNWLVPAHSNDQFCLACSLNRTIPDINKPEFMERWKKIEMAKHRLIYSLLRLQLPVEPKLNGSDIGLSFDFIANLETGKKEKVVLTGHARGLITINIAEADDIEREMTRKKMQEVYRTVLGHFRHEVGHYYWDRLIGTTPGGYPETESTQSGPGALTAFRKLFGDERADYGEALDKHYKDGPRPDPNHEFISTYASVHPWEDWAETWAHYLHIIDTLETAHAWGLSIDPVVAEKSDAITVDIDRDPYSLRDFNSLVKQWFPLTVAMNSLNRSMGLADPYPFVISEPVIKKLQFIHDMCYSFRKSKQAVK